MNTHWSIRPEAPCDYAQIREMTISAFAAAYGTGILEADLIEALRIAPDHDPALALVAVRSEVVGHVMLSPVTICDGDGRTWDGLCVAPLGVRIGHQRQGIGKALMHTALAAATERGHTRIVISGNPEYYARFGFQDAALYEVQDELGTPSPHFMVLPLAQGAFAGVSGTVVYPASWDHVRQAIPPTLPAAEGGPDQAKGASAMELHTVGLLSPGDMGHAVGRVLVAHGLRVITCLEGRSARTRDLAAEAGIHDVASYRELVTQAQLILSIVVPAQALAVAQRVAAAITDAERGGGDALTYADCNAIAPQTARQVEGIITGAGARFVDGGIIGGPPGDGVRNRIYVSGEHLGAMLALNGYGLEIVDLHGGAGQASGLKMCYAALTKGLTALCTELLVAAEALGISEPLAQELSTSQGAMYTRMERGVPSMLPKAHRWIGEMEEIASTFGALGLTPDMLQGAAEMYRLVMRTELGTRTPEDPRPLPGMEETIITLAEALVKPEGTGQGSSS